MTHCPHPNVTNSTINVTTPNLNNLSNINISHSSSHRYCLDPCEADYLLSHFSSKTSHANHTGLCFRSQCGVVASGVLLLGDSERERTMRLGPPLSAGPLAAGDCMVSAELAAALSLRVGGSVRLLLDLPASLKHLWGEATAASPPSVSPPTTEHERPFDRAVVELRVASIYTSLSLKYPLATPGRSIVAEYSQILSVLAASLHPHTPIHAGPLLATSDLDEYAGEVVCNFPPSMRASLYSSSDTGEIQRRFVGFLGPLFYQLGFDQLRSSTPILTDMAETYKWVSMFLGLTIQIILGILVVLSTILIYSLLSSSVADKKFLIGVLRMVGMDKPQLAQMILIQAACFSVPAVLLGIPLSQLLLWGCQALLSALAAADLSLLLTPGAVLEASLLAVSVSLLASTLPLRAALSSNLRESLEVRPASAAMASPPLSAALPSTSPLSQAFPLPLLALGLLLAAFGFGTYYLFPHALLQTNLPQLLQMFFLLLFLMLFGLSTLALHAQHWMERAVLWAFFFWESAVVKGLVVKNLRAHQRRNKLTSLLYAISIAFIVFLYVSYTVQLGTLSNAVQRSFGAPISLSHPTGFPLAVQRALDEQLHNATAVESFSWISVDLYDVLKWWFHFDEDLPCIMNAGRLNIYLAAVHAISPNFFQTSYSRFLQVTPIPHVAKGGDGGDGEEGKDDSLDHDLAQSLYLQDSVTSGTLVSSGYQTKLGYSWDPLPWSYLLRYTFSSLSHYFQVRPVAFLASSPCFSFSSTVVDDWDHPQSVLVSFPTFRAMAGLSSMDEIPLSRLLIKPHSSASSADIDHVVALITAASASEGEKATLWDERQAQTVFDIVDVLMWVFFGFTLVVAMLISFFSLSSSMLANIQEQIREIAILRAVGMGSVALTKIFVLEAFCVVAASSANGVLIGTFLGWVTSKQTALFSNLPVPMSFPLGPLILSLLLSALSAFLSSYFQLASILQRSITENLRT